eukprot:6212437-Pleurochrysis_carterae.AAC.2
MSAPRTQVSSLASAEQTLEHARKCVRRPVCCSIHSPQVKEPTVNDSINRPLPAGRVGASIYMQGDKRRYGMLISGISAHADKRYGAVMVLICN